MAKARTKSKTNAAVYTPEKTRELLLGAAKILFSKQGFDGITVKELADYAGVNVSLVSYHFGGKEGLYRACIDQFGQARLDVAQRLLIKPQSLEEFKVRLHMFIEELIECFVAEPELARIIQRECDLDLPVIQDIFARTFLRIHDTLAEFFQTSQKLGFVRKQLDAQILTELLFGALNNFAKKDHMREKYFNKSIKDMKFRKKVTEELYDFFLNGVISEQRHKKE